MNKFKSKVKLRTALVSLAVLTLLAATTAFFVTNAGGAVSDSDVSGSDVSENGAAEIGFHTAEVPDDLGDPKITMTTSKAVGEKLSHLIISCNGSTTTYIDWGDGSIVQYYVYDTLKGQTVKIYNKGNISYLTCTNNQLTAFDVSKNTFLQVLDCTNNQLTALDLSKNTALNRLDCTNNQLTALDVSKNTALAALYCGGNQLTALDLSNNTALKTLNCQNNNLKFSTLGFAPSGISTCTYSPQAAVTIPSSVKAGAVIDLSSEYSVKGTNTVYKWYDSDDNAVTPASSGNGRFTFGNDLAEKTLHCVMTNSYYPDLTLTTTAVKVQPNLGEPKVTMTTSKAVGEKLSLSITNTGTTYIDWGDGSIVQYSSSDTLKGQTVKIYSTGEITKLYCYTNQLTALDVSKNTALKELYCDTNRLTTLDLSKNTDLKNLYCNTNQLTALDVSKNTALTYLYCNTNQLTALDVSKNTALTSLYCYGNQLTALDLSNNTALTSLYCYGNKLTALDVSKNTALKTLSCYDNQLSSLNLSKNTDLKNLYCYGNKLTTLDVSKNTTLTFLSCEGNQLTALDLSNNTALTYLSCYHNQLTALDLSNNTALTSLKCQNNKLKFSTLGFAPSGISTCTYSPQAAVTIPSSVKAGAVIDLSSEYSVKGTNTVYTWYDSSNNAVTPASSGNGRFTFGNDLAEKTLHCVMTNSYYPDLELSTTAVKVQPNLGEPKVTMTTSRAVGNTLPLSITDSGMTYIDWGDGSIVQYSSSGTLKGQNVKIYSTGDITTLSCSNNRLTALDVSKNTALTLLSCDGNQLTKLDLSKNTALTTLYCGGNQLTALDLSKNTALTTLYCHSNQLTALDVSNNTALTYLYCNYNQLKFSTLGFAPSGISTCTYSPQAAVTIPSSVKAGEVIDLSSEYNINGTNTVYTWYDSSNNAVTPASSENGRFTFGNDLAEKTIYCKMTNGYYPALTLSTTAVKVQPDLGDPKITMTTSKAVGDTLPLSITDSGMTYIDWGDGSIVLYSSSDTLKGQNVKIYSTGEITDLYCNNNQLTALDVSGCSALTELYCIDNQLTALDVSKNTALTGLDCHSNQLTALDVSKNTALTTLYCHSNQLTALDLSKNTALTTLYCTQNQLTALDVSNNTALTWLNCGKNQLTSLNVSNNTALNTLYCDTNQLTALDLSKNTALTTLYCQNNKLKFSTLGFEPSGISTCTYSPQNKLAIPSSVKAGMTVDLSSEYDINGTNTVYTWYDSDGSEVTPTSSEGGVFTFGKDFVEKSLHCEMTNGNYPDLTLTTTDVEIQWLKFDNNGTSFIADVEPSDDLVLKDKNDDVIYMNSVKLIVNAIGDDDKASIIEAIANYNYRVSPKTKNYLLYDIYLVDNNGDKVTVASGTIKICLNYPESLGSKAKKYSYEIYHQKADGSIEGIDGVTCGSDGVWFETNDFSPYALVWTPKTSTSANTGESSTPIVVSIILMTLSLAAVGGVFFRKKLLACAK